MKEEQQNIEAYQLLGQMRETKTPSNDLTHHKVEKHSRRDHEFSEFYPHPLENITPIPEPLPPSHTPHSKAVHSAQQRLQNFCMIAT
jgi:hypothetical protein